MVMVDLPQSSRGGHELDLVIEINNKIRLALKEMWLSFQDRIHRFQAAFWFALTAILLDYPYSLEVEELPIVRYSGNSSLL
jgi:hypothetical protein